MDVSCSNLSMDVAPNNSKKKKQNNTQLHSRSIAHAQRKIALRNLYARAEMEVKNMNKQRRSKVLLQSF